MALSIGIVGLPNVGKSTLFNTLTKNKVAADNFPFCTIDPNVGIVKVPDERLDVLTQLSRSRRTIPAAIEFIDIAGLVKGAHAGEGLGNKFLANIRECDAICEVLRNFSDKNVHHVEGRVDPLADRETIATELIMADLQSMEKARAKIGKEAKSGGKEIKARAELIERMYAHLDNGQPARTLALDEQGQGWLADHHLLTMKPIIYAVNADEGAAPLGADWDGEFIYLNIKQEEEITALPPEEQSEFIRELGLEESGLSKLVKAGYRLLGLQTFLTTGPDESRAWTIRRGTKAPQAAGVIHTDFEKGFIRAEVVNYSDFVELGSEQAAREAGKIRTEGKDYEIKDGDICHFLVNR